MQLRPRRTTAKTASRWSTYNDRGRAYSVDYREIYPTGEKPLRPVGRYDNNSSGADLARNAPKSLMCDPDKYSF